MGLRLLIIAICIAFGPVAVAADSPYGGQFDSVCGGQWTKVPTQAMIQLIGRTMGSRSHRLWHAFWHSLRGGGWNMMSQQQQELLRRAARVQAGINPNSNQRPPDGRDWQPNGAKNGIDFFYMHHVMLTRVFQSLRRAGMPCLEPWGIRLGMGAGDSPGWNAPNLASMMQQASKFLGDPSGPERDYLYKVPSLGALGDDLERTLHSSMHSNYGAADPNKFNFQCQIADALIGRSQAEGGDAEEAAALDRWQRGQCEDWRNNDLLYTATSHVHWVFYKLHGLVEVSMLSWAKIHGYDGVETPEGTCPGRGACFRFRSELGRAPWQGATPRESAQKRAGNDDPHAAHEGVIASLQKALDSMADQKIEERSIQLAEQAITDPKVFAAILGDRTQFASDESVVKQQFGDGIRKLAKTPAIRDRAKKEVKGAYHKLVREMVETWEKRLGKGLREDKASQAD